MTAAAAYGYTAVGVIVAGFGVYAALVLGGHGIACLPRVIAFRATRTALRALIAIRSAVTRARWAWACRKPPARTEGEKLSRADHLTFTGLVETWRQSGAPERSRT